MKAFYEICNENPIDHSSQAYMYSFLDLEKTEELEEFIVGIWIKNHLPAAEMKKHYQATV